MGCETCHVTHKTGADLDARKPVPPDQSRPGALRGLPRSERCRAAAGASEPALRHGELPELPRSAPVGGTQADGKVRASPVCRQAMRSLPRSGERRESGPDASERKRSLRHLPRRQGEADREREGAASRSSRRLHRLPQPARQRVPGPAENRSGEHLSGLPQRTARRR